MNEFKNIVKELRESKQWSQQDLADKLHTTKQTVSQYERGVRHPSRENLIALGDIFNVSTDYLLGNQSITTRLVDKEEIELIDGFRTLSPKNRKTVLDLISIMSRNN